MAAPDEATFAALREEYRAGIPTRWGAPERATAAALWALLEGLEASQQQGAPASLPVGTFWDEFSD